MVQNDSSLAFSRRLSNRASGGIDESGNGNGGNRDSGIRNSAIGNSTESEDLLNASIKDSLISRGEIMKFSKSLHKIEEERQQVDGHSMIYCHTDSSAR